MTVFDSLRELAASRDLHVDAISVRSQARRIVAELKKFAESQPGIISRSSFVVRLDSLLGSFFKNCYVEYVFSKEKNRMGTVVTGKDKLTIKLWIGGEFKNRKRLLKELDEEIAENTGSVIGVTTHELTHLIQHLTNPDALKRDIANHSYEGRVSEWVAHVNGYAAQLSHMYKGSLPPESELRWQVQTWILEKGGVFGRRTTNFDKLLDEVVKAIRKIKRSKR